MSERSWSLLRGFIESDAAPRGKWWVDVPVGLSVGDEDDHARIDAVCLTSREQELPEVYAEHTGTKYVAPQEDSTVGVTKADRFRSLRDQETFADETAVLVTAESGWSSVESVGELLAYRELLEADWDWTIDELVLVSDDDSDHVSHACRKLGVRAVRVSE